MNAMTLEIKIYDNILQEYRNKEYLKEKEWTDIWVVGDGHQYNKDHLCVKVKSEDVAISIELLRPISLWAVNKGRERHFGRFLGHANRKKIESCIKNVLEKSNIRYIIKWEYYQYSAPP